MELARQGFHLVLIAHTAADLDELATSLRDKYKIQVMTISMDASSATPRDIETQLIQRLFQDETDVSILVNAVGVYNCWRKCASVVGKHHRHIRQRNLVRIQENLELQE